MKLTHLLAGIAVAGGAVAGGVKGYVHYQVKSDIDELIAVGRAFADISYADLDTDLSGSVTLHGLRILPHDFPDHFQIDALTVGGPDMDFLLNGFGGSRERGELPAQAWIEMRGWHMRADSALVQGLRKSTATLAGLLNIESDSCSLGQVFGAKDFTAIGYDEFLVDARMGYRFADTFPGVELSWDFRAAGESGSFGLTLVDVSRDIHTMPPKIPRLRDMRMTYRLEPDFTRKLVDYCAAQRGVDAETYIAQLAAEPDVLYQIYMGFVPGPGLRDAFQDMLRNPGEMVVAARPVDPLDLTTLGLYQPSQLPDLLGLTVSVNGRAVDDLSLSFVDLGEHLDGQMRDAIGRDGFWSDLGIEPPASSTIRPATAARAEPPRYRSVDQAQLGEHIGRPVRIVASGGRKRNGVLKSVERGIATVEERRYGGTLTSTIALREIVKAEAYH